MTEADLYLQHLLEADPLRKPLLDSVIESLNLPSGSRGLDAGCGIGLQTQSLAQAVGPEGHVTGLDLLPELLEYGERLGRDAGLSERISFQQGDVSRLPFESNHFDWVWSADCIGYPAGRWSSLLQGLIRVVKPGGAIFLLGWSSQQVLPGHPLLEASLNATCSGYLPFFKEKRPDENFMRALYWFQQTGLEEIRGQTFVRDIQSPFSDRERAALISLFEMLWGSPQPETSPEDWRQYQQLCKPASPQFILDIPGYYAFFTCTLFSGKVPLTSN